MTLGRNRRAEDCPGRAHRTCIKVLQLYTVGSEVDAEHHRERQSGRALTWLRDIGGDGCGGAAAAAAAADDDDDDDDAASADDDDDNADDGEYNDGT
jgi:hypothetical protein